MTIINSKSLIKIISAIISVSLMTSLTACSTEPSTSTNLPASVTESSISSADTSDSSPEATSDTTEDKPIYDGVFKGISDGSYTSGAPMSYDEAMDMITSPFQKENGIFLDSFFIVETIRVLSDEETRNLNGWTIVCDDKTMYEVKILTDLISGEEVNRIEKILVGTGTIEWQQPGDPVYAPGERFTVMLTKSQEGCDYLYAPVGSMFRYDIVEDASGTTLYSRGSEIDKLNLPASTNLDERIITTTTQNPVVHSQKVELDTLTDYLRSDWEKRGVSTHFEKEGNE